MADGLTQCDLVLKGMIERDDPRAYYRGRWSRVEGARIVLLSRGWVEVSFGHWTVTEAGLDYYVERALWVARHG